MPTFIVLFRYTREGITVRMDGVPDAKKDILARTSRPRAVGLWPPRSGPENDIPGTGGGSTAT